MPLRSKKVKIATNLYTDSREYEIDRISGIGSADVADVFSLEPYGCARKLMYEKLKFVPDYDEDKATQNFHIRRGLLFENLAGEMYANMTKRRIRTPNRAFRSDYHPFMIAHIDKLVLEKGEKTYPLEIKNPSKSHYLKIKYALNNPLTSSTAIPQSWLLQLQHQIFVKESGKGAFAIMSPELGEMLPSIDIPRDDALIQNFIVKGEGAFWAMKDQNMLPNKLPNIEDVRCAKCAYRITCRGEIGEFLTATTNEYVYAEEPVFHEMSKQYLDLGDEIAERDEARAMLKEQMLNLIKTNKTPKIKTDYARVMYLEFIQKKWDMNKLKKDHPDFEALYKNWEIKIAQFRVLRVNSKEKEK
jgi:putative phage-type endonuclease